MPDTTLSLPDPKTGDEGFLLGLAILHNLEASAKQAQLLNKGLFELGAIPLHCSRERVDDLTRYHFRGTVGYLPFTIESLPARKLVLRVLEATHTVVPNVLYATAEHTVEFAVTFSLQGDPDDAPVIAALLGLYAKLQPAFAALGAALDIAAPKSTIPAPSSPTER